MNRRQIQATQLAEVEWYVEVSERVIDRSRRERCKTPQTRQHLALFKEMRRWHIAHRDWLRKQLGEVALVESFAISNGIDLCPKSSPNSCARNDK
jgi:hypothetical protein